MKIDGHHTLTYIAARLAGYDNQQASTIAYSAQYVDDATHSGVIHFDNKAMYSRISSAHKMLDYRNTDALANHRVWIPFHFLPGNGGKPPGENPDGSFVEKLICYPDSPVARDMLRACVNDHAKPYALHRLGITMHVYADTWAHQGFAGIVHEVNGISDMKSNNKALDERWFAEIASRFIGHAFPLGHGAALSYPDRQSLIWEYTNGRGKKIERNNSALFLEATDKMCRAMQCFRKNDPGMNLESVSGLPEKDAAKITALFESITSDSGDERHAAWTKAIKQGSFSFGSESIEYIATGEGSWKHQSIGTLGESYSDEDDFEEDKIFTYKKSFLSSDWKYFHDALQAHRFEVLHDILPTYGICAA